MRQHNGLQGQNLDTTEQPSSICEIKPSALFQKLESKQMSLNVYCFKRPLGTGFRKKQFSIYSHVKKLNFTLLINIQNVILAPEAF